MPTTKTAGAAKTGARAGQTGRKTGTGTRAAKTAPPVPAAVPAKKPEEEKTAAGDLAEENILPELAGAHAGRQPEETGGALTGEAVTKSETEGSEPSRGQSGGSEQQAAGLALQSTGPETSQAAPAPRKRGRPRKHLPPAEGTGAESAEVKTEAGAGTVRKKPKAAKRDSQDQRLVFGPLTEKQQLFMAARAKYVGYGGARGGGKSFSARYKAVGMCMTYPGIRILMVRAHYPELEENLINPILRWVPQGLRSYNGAKHKLTFVNGSEIKFGHWDGQAAEDEYQGTEWDVIFIDEATQISERAFNYLCTTVRGVNDFPKRVYITCNPGGVGHNWVKRLFITRDYRMDNEDPALNENPADYYFIAAQVKDNPYLMEANPDYVRQLAGLPEEIRNAHLYGDWDSLGGSYFKNFSQLKHCFRPFPIPKHWPMYRSLDYGLDMFALGFWAVDTDGRCWLFRYFESPNLVVKDAARQALEHTLPDENILCSYAPPDMWNRSKDSGKTVAEIFAQTGLPLVKADNNRVQGHLIVRNMLQDIPLKDPFVQGLFPKGEAPDSLPGLMIFDTADCRHVAEDLRDIQADSVNPNDCAKQPHDVTHSVDMVRYFCISRVAPAEEPEPSPEADEDERDEDYESFLCGGSPDDGYMAY